MTTDTNNKHYECRKCGNTAANYTATKNQICDDHKPCDWKTNQPHWDNTMLGMTLNITWRLTKWVFRSVSKLASRMTAK